MDGNNASRSAERCRSETRTKCAVKWRKSIQEGRTAASVYGPFVSRHMKETRLSGRRGTARRSVSTASLFVKLIDRL